MAGVRRYELTTLGLRTRVLEAGPARQEAVVFVHGGPGSASDWDWFLPRVGEMARAIAFDLPGFGAADKPFALGYSAQTWATYMQGVLQKLDVRRAHVVCTDLGAESALTWAAAHEDTFASAVAMNSGPLVRYRWHAVGQLHRLPVLGMAATYGGIVGLRPVMRFYAPKVPREVIARWAREYDLGTRRALTRFYRNSRAIATSPLIPELKALDRPGLVIWGRRNRFVPVKHAADLQECFPGGEVEIFDDLGHYAHLEDPERVGARLLPFLEKQLSD